MNRRIHLSTMFAALLLTAAPALGQAVGQKFTPPVSPRMAFNFNSDWKFIRQAKVGDQLPGFFAPAFDDSPWANVSLPHT